MGRLMRNGKEYGGGPAGSGHEILNNAGTSMAQESKLQFKGQNVSDDSTNGKTIVTSTIECTQAEYDALAQAGNVLPDVDYYISDTSPVAIDAAHLPYSSTLSTKQAIDAKANTADLAAVATSGSGDDVSYDNTHSVNEKIDSVASNQYYHKGDSYTLNVLNLMLAGRTGWSGKQFYFGIFLDKPAGSDVTGATIDFGSGGAVYLLSYNQAIDISNTSRTNTLYVAAGRKTISLEMIFNTAPLSITDGIVNLMINKLTTITFT